MPGPVTFLLGNIASIPSSEDALKYVTGHRPVDAIFQFLHWCVHLVSYIVISSNVGALCLFEVFLIVSTCSAKKQFAVYIS